MIYSVILLGIIFVLTIVLGFRRNKRITNLPPGPKPNPIFGNLLELWSNKFPMKLEEMGKPYGGIFTFYAFNRPVVMLHSFQLIKEYLGSPKYGLVFSTRPKSYMNLHLLPEDIVFGTCTEGWKKLKKLSYKGIKQYGTSLASLEEHIKEELQVMLTSIRLTNGQAHDPLMDIHTFMCNVILILSVGRRFDAGAVMLDYVNKNVSSFTILTGFTHSIILDRLPWLTYLPCETSRQLKILEDNTSAFMKAARQVMGEDVNEMPDCLLSLLLKEQQEGNITEEGVKGVMVDGIIAGVSTTRTALYALLLMLVHYPEVQRKMKAEISQVLGKRSPVLEDRVSLPYTMATILEILRLVPSLVMPPLRICSKDTTMDKYFIPKNTMVWFNIWFIHHDPSFWRDPHHFIPERFLDDKGQLLPPEAEKRQRIIAFGMGRRVCIGETLAKARLYHALVTILQNFDLQADPAHPLPSRDPRDFKMSAFSLIPNYKIRFIPI